MAILYCDYEGGNNANNGSNFALRFKDLTNGATAARIAPGDEIRIMASPDPTSLGQNATWTDGPLPVTFVPTSSTNATPIVFTKVGHGLVTGDTVIVQSHTTNTNANGVWDVTVDGDTFTLLNIDGSNSVGNGVGGATGTVRKITNSVVKLATAVTKNIACFGNQGSAGKVAWTPSANVTSSISASDYKEGQGGQTIAIAAGFATGLAAYFATGALDLSGYQQVSFWVKQTVGVITASSSVSLTLCSDAAGTTPVHTINIPLIGSLARWSPVTVNLGTALSSGINSIGFVVNNDVGAQTFLLDNIIACKASSAVDSLSNVSLVGKNTSTEGWYGIQSINGTRVILDMDTNCVPRTAPSRGYSGTTETVETWKRETIKTDMTALTSIVQEIKNSGVEGNPITFSGGWNRTDMSTQIGETFFDGQNGSGYGVYIPRSYLNILNISSCRYNYGFFYQGNVCTGVHNNLSNCGRGLHIDQTKSLNEMAINSASNCTDGVYVNSSYENTIKVVHSNNNSNYGISSTSSVGNKFNIKNLKNNGNRGLSLASFANRNKIKIEQSSGNVADVDTGIGNNYLTNSTLNSASKVLPSNDFANGFLWSTNENGNTDTHFGYTNGGLISSDITTVHTAGMSWKLSPTDVSRSVSYPLPLKVAVGAVAANTPITCKVWFRRDNIGLTARLVCKGGQLTGIDNDVSTLMTAAADTWEELSVTVTPTQKGVLEFYAEVWGGSTYNCWTDDVSFT